MEILGFEIQIDSDVMELSFLDAISEVMENHLISIESGIEIISMHINGQISEIELYRYVYAQNESGAILQDQLFANLDRWQEVVGPFFSNDMLYLNSKKQTKVY